MNKNIDLRNDDRFDELLAAYGDSFASLSGSINPDPLIEYIESVYAPLAAAVPAEEASDAPFPERDPNVPAEQQGLFRKFDVRRVDGSDQPGGKHHGCRYYVLDLTHDQHAPAAMRAYAASCRVTHPQLAVDIEAEFGTPAEPAPIQWPVDTIQSSALTDERITELNREAQDQAISGIEPSIYLARAIEREVLARLSTPTAQGAANKDVEWLMQCAEEAQDAPEIATKIRAHCMDAAKREASQSPAQVTGEAPSIDTPEFREFLNAYLDELNDETDSALIAHINRHIAAQATAGRDASMLSNIILTDPDGGSMCISSDLEYCPNGAMKFTVTNPNTGRRLGVVLELVDLKPEPSHAAEQASGGAK